MIKKLIDFFTYEVRFNYKSDTTDFHFEAGINTLWLILIIVCWTALKVFLLYQAANKNVIE